MKMTKKDECPKIMPKAKKGYSQKILDLEVGSSLTYPQSKESIESINNAIKHVRKYLGHHDRLFRTMKISDTKRKVWRIQ